MPRRAASVCSVPGCPTLTRGGRCTSCRAQAEQQRGQASQRGYGKQHRDRFRAVVLARDPWCVLCLKQGVHTASTVADHWPKSRRELEAEGLDPDAPEHGRGLCVTHHAQETARLQPGGFNAR